jgi:TfoX/Sxy family transcriptional regulator of competence genes
MNADELPGAVRAALAGARAVREIKMFGGIGFMLNGNMVAAASKRGLLLRVGSEREADALRRPGTRPMEMRGRKMDGYVYVDPAELTAEAVKEWIDLATAFVQTLPAKAAGEKPTRIKRKAK